MLPHTLAGQGSRGSSSSSSSLSSTGSSADGSSLTASSDSESSSSRSVSPPAPRQAGVSPPPGVANRVQLNPSLQFERPDNEYIPLPANRAASPTELTLRTLLKDRGRYPEGRYRRLDYLRAAIEMFVAQVRLEFEQQNKVAQRNNRADWRFTWKNKGELAICFACCCDMLKLLYDVVQPTPLKPSWESFVAQMSLVLMSESRIPTTVLAEHTYRTKYQDWQKGGTRYAGDQCTANVRFPSAHERKVKIETYLRSGAGYRIEAVTVDPQTAATQRAVRPQPQAVAVAPVATPSLPIAPGVRLEVKGGPPLVSAMVHTKGMEPARIPASGGKAAAAPAATYTLLSAKQLPEEMRHLYWLSALARIKGGAPIAAMPDDRLAAMPGLVRLCDITDAADEIRLLLDVLLASSETAQGLFERLGGMLSIRRFVSQCVRSKDGTALMQVMERLVRFHATPWGAASQKTWRTNMDNVLTPDMGWLRSVPCVPPEKRAAWGAILLVMEQKFIFRPSRDVAMAALKREREEPSSPSSPHTAETTIRCAALDNIDIPRWRESRVHTFDACRLPAALRAPPLSSVLEQDTVDFLNTRKRFAEMAQEVWRRSLLEALHRNHAGAFAGNIPLWYDAYQLLGIDPAVLGQST